MPFNGVNPSIRVYDYDVKERKIVNFQQHYLPLDNLNPEDSPDETVSMKKEPAEDEFLLKDDRRSRNSKFMKHPADSNRKKRDSVDGKKSLKVGRKGKGTPKYLRNPKFLKCLDKSQKILCLPPVIPKKCDQSTYKKIKSMEDPYSKPPDCDADQKDQKANVESSTNVSVPDVSLNSQTDESFPLNPAREDKKESDVDSRSDEDELKTSNEDDVGDQLNASVAIDTDLVGKWRFAFDASKDLNVTEMTPENMLNVWSNMKSYGDKTFAAFEKEIVVLKEGFKFDEDRHAYIICSIRHVFEDELKDCLSEMGSKMPPPWKKATTTHTSEKDIVETTVPPPEDIVASTTALKALDTTADNEDSDKFTTEQPKKPSIISDLTDDDSIKKNNSKENTVTDEEGASSGVTAVVVLTLLILFITGAAILYKRRDRWRNRQADEFLLTDSVFKYDGYSQVDEFS